MKNNVNIFERLFLAKFLFVCIFLVLGSVASAQVNKKVDFKPRVSSLASGDYKNKPIYNLRGDFTMIGNSNHYKNPYSDAGGNGNNYMSFHKLSGDGTDIKNSSSADLVLSGLDVSCTQIVYAGLYWSGRGNDSDGDSFNGLNKKKVKLKVPNKGYEDVTAVDIFYGGSDVSGMYTGYVDITDKVRFAGTGTYAVANIASREGDGGGTGYYAGWGIVIIYENPTLPWRNITVFDGFSQIKWDGKTTGGWNSTKIPTYGTLDLSGFSAVQNGPVNIKMGMMAGEGDQDISGDVFQIRQRNSNNYTTLSHSGNTENNFFNSSIFTGGNPRVPNRKNNYGTDISMFNLPNSGNVLIDNKQTSTRFQFGTTQDLYVIYNIVFAVDAYVPEIVGENSVESIGGQKPTHNGTISPGQLLEFQLDVKNKGTEAVDSTKIEIPVPFNLHFVSADIQNGFSVKGNVKWIPPVGGTNDPAVTAGGTILWDIGTLPLDASNKERILAELKYRFKVSNDCILLSTNECGLEVRINGKISGTGTTSQTNVNADLVRGYGDGACAGPVYDDFISTITLGADFLQSCKPPVEDGVMQFKAFCSVPTTGFPRADVMAVYPEGTKFFSTVPASYTSIAGLVTGDFAVNADGSKKMYYVMVPGMKDGCYARLEISVEKVVTEPTAKNVAFCFGDPIVLENALSPTGITNQYSLVYFDANNNQLQSVPSPTAVGVYSYFVAEGKSGCIGPKKPFTITINALPVIVGEFNNIEVCTNFDGSTTVSTTGTGLSYAWEYSTTGGTTWQTLSNTTFSGKIILTNSTLEVKHAEVGLNGTKVRLKVGNGTPCSATSNVFEIKVKDCPAVTNPMLLNRGIQ